MNTLRTLTLCMALLAGNAALRVCAEKYEVDIQPFAEISVTDGVAVDCICSSDSTGTATFCCTPEHAAHIMMSNTAGKLHIYTDATEEPLTGLPRITVYTTALRRIENDSDSTLHVYGLCCADGIKVRQSGNGHCIVDHAEAQTVEASMIAGQGTITIAGHADMASLRSVGRGDINAGKLHCKAVRALAVGPGDIHCSPTEALSVRGLGHATIHCHTSPAKISKRAPGVRLTMAD